MANLLGNHSGSERQRPGPVGSTPVTDAALDQQMITATRVLAMDAPLAAKSGHQGTAMSLAPVAQVLFGRVMRHDPADPSWPDRDRFVLSAGHASILLYSMLHLHGYDLTMDDLRAFRQWGSRTPGHPEVGHTAGVEVTTGPLGQGISNAVGMAIAERFTRARFGAELCDHHVFVIAGDGCLQEGVSHEAASLAGHLGLGRIVAIYDDNHITIDGHTELSFSDDSAARFEAYGWHVERLGEIGEDLDALEAAIRRAMAVEDRPSLLVLRTHIAYPSPTLTDDHRAHGLAFAAAEVTETKAVLGVPDEPFAIDADAAARQRQVSMERGGAARAAWEARFGGWTGDKAAWQAAQAGRGIEGWHEALPTWAAGEKVATRVAVQKCFEAALPGLPGLVSGAADLTDNTGTRLKGEAAQSAAEPGGRQLYFGVREHGMGAALNGMALHGGVLPVGGTFFVFSDYMRGAVRLAALSGAKSVFVWTHDSVGVGEDGPTHQPVEQLAAIRAIPGLRVLRPADANETAAAVRLAVDGAGPSALILSRQNLPVLEGTSFEGVSHGAYILSDTADPQVVLVGTGSEVQWCVAAATTLGADGIRARVVSMPSWDLFETAGASYRDVVLPPGVPVVSIEAGVTFGWHRWADHPIGIDRFGASAPGDTVMRELGITTEAVVAAARSLVS